MHFVLQHLDVRQGAGPKDTRDRRQIVQLFARIAGASRNTDRLHLASGLQRGLERQEIGSGEQRAQIDKFQTKTQVWFVRAIAFHGLTIGQPAKRRLNHSSIHGEDLGDQRFDQSEKLFPAEQTTFRCRFV